MARPKAFSATVLITIVLTCLTLGGLAGCRLDEAPTDDTIRIALVAPLFPPPAGDGQLTFRVSDENDRPIDSAALKIRADMTHAGMLPIAASTATGEAGVYRIPVRWTMAGEWIIIVEATLGDGRQATRSFDMTVTGEEEECIDDQ